LTPNELVLTFGVYTSVSNLVKFDEEMRPWECPQTNTHTHGQTQNDFIICPMLCAIAMGQIKTAKSRFAPHFGGLRGNVHSSSMARWKARGRLPSSADWTFFASYRGWGAMSGCWSKSLCSKGGHFERKFQGEGEVAHQRLLCLSYLFWLLFRTTRYDHYHFACSW